MGLSETCIRRPVMTTLLMASILLAGVAGYRQLPMAAIPRIDVPTIQVSATLPGASPDAMAVSVAAPLERQFATIAGVKDITSTSTEGATQIVLEFDLNRSIDAAALDVQSAISVATARLPAEIAAPPSFRKVNPADSPVIFMALTSDTAPSQEMNEFADKVMSPRLSMLPGVAQVNINGAQKRAVRIKYNLDALAARGIAVDELRTAVGALTSVSPLGSIRTERQKFFVEDRKLLHRKQHRSGVDDWNGLRRVCVQRSGSVGGLDCVIHSSCRLVQPDMRPASRMSLGTVRMPSIVQRAMGGNAKASVASIAGTWPKPNRITTGPR